MLYSPPRQRQSAADQFLRFASTGLIATSPPASGRRVVPVYIAAAAGGLATLLGAATIAVALIVDRGLAVIGIGTTLVATGATITLVAAYLGRFERGDDLAIRPTPGAVLPPDLLRAGHWIHHQGAWTRVREVGAANEGIATVLVSSGEILDVDRPITVAGGAFAPAEPRIDLLDY